jgi:lactate permease
MPFAANVQDLDPLGFRLGSTLVAALPVLILFYLLVGRRWLASWAGAVGAGVAILVAWLVYGMPLEMASWSFVHGAVFGLLPIGWTVFAAMLLYNMTVETGQFAVIRRSIGGLSGDARVQAVLIGFAFGAFMEGAAGAGSPVAICGAMLVGLGVPPFRAAVICLVANTSPVCYGGLGVPILTLGNVTDIPPETISVMCGHQLPILSCLIPLYMVKCMCSWRETLAIWPALLVGGGSFALFQYFFATMHLWIPGFSLWPLTDIGGGLFSLVSLALFLKFVWKPRLEWRFPGEIQKEEKTKPDLAVGHDPQLEEGKAEAALLLDSAFRNLHTEIPLTARRVAVAWSPFLLMAACLAGAGVIRQQESAQKHALDFEIGKTYYEQPVPTLHNRVERAYELQKPVPSAGLAAIAGVATLEAAVAEGVVVRDGPQGVKFRDREAAVIKISWATAPGTPVFVAAMIAMLFLRMSRSQIQGVFRKTCIQMKVPIPTIACMLGLSYVTKYAGIDATLGVAFAGTGAFYPFFAAILGWLGVFLTGTDAGSNALFGSLQKITATEVWNTHHTGAMSHLTLEQAQLVICTANSTGGVMGKMVDAQSICVATAGTNQIGKEADIFKAVIWHSLFLASVVGVLTALQVFVPPFTHMVPKP